MIVKRHARTLLASFIPANMVWVFLACALQCVAAAEPACGQDEYDTCCLSTVFEAGIGVALSAPETQLCLLVPREHTISADRTSTQDERRTSASFLTVTASDAVWRPRSDVPRCGVDPPPKWRPFDRLPVIRV